MCLTEIICPLCGAPVDFFDICDVCNWHNSGDKECDSGVRGPNSMTLGEAKAIYAKTKKPQKW